MYFDVLSICILRALVDCETVHAKSLITVTFSIERQNVQVAFAPPER